MQQFTSPRALPSTSCASLLSKKARLQAREQRMISRLPQAGKLCQCHAAGWEHSARPANSAV